MTEIRVARVKRIKPDELTVAPEELFAKALKLAKKGKLRQAKNTLKKAGVELYMERFVKEGKEKKIDEMLDSVEDIIKALKILYENGKEFVSDKIYDITLDKFKSYRDEPIEAMLFVGRRTKDTTHEYPLLRGTLDKAHFIYIADNRQRKEGTKDVETFIRSWMSRSRGPLRIRLSLKYDGVSVILDIDSVSGKVVSAITRGDDGNGTDLTHLFQNVRYPNALNEMGLNFGLKTELIVTKANRERYMEEKGKSYANCRSAAVSIVSASNGAKYAKYLTPVPLYAVTDTDEEVSYQVINKMFAQNLALSFIEVEATSVKEAMAKINDFIADFREKRPDLGFAIDGIVIDVINEEVREEFGRTGAINKYQVAYKYPPDEVQTTVKGFEVTVGRTGLLTPILFYDPIELNGTIHNHSSLSSYERFSKMNLHYGDTVTVSYNGDVMPYVQPTVRHNGMGPVIGYPDTCPSCGGSVVQKGKNYFCANGNCTTKHLNRITFFIKALGLKDFADKTVIRLYDEGLLTDIPSLFNLDYSAILQLDGFGESKVKNLQSEIERIKTEPIHDYNLCNALGISGPKTSEQILNWFTLEEIMRNSYSIATVNIPNVKDAKKENFIDGLDEVIPTLQYLLAEVFKDNIIHSKFESQQSEGLKKVMFTGFRDKDLKKECEAKGYKVVDGGFKGLAYLVAIDPHDTSKKKVAKALDKGIKVISRKEFEKKVRG